VADEGLEWVHGKESASGVSRAIYHLTVRANGEAEMFEDDDDRRYLLGRIAVATRMLCQYGGLTQRAAAPLLGTNRRGGLLPVA